MQKEERHKIYKEALSYVQEFGWRHHGFCGILKRILKNYPIYSFIYIYDFTQFKKHFPEIAKHKPKKSGMFWFEWQKEKDPIREKILKQAIRETAVKKSYKKVKTKVIKKTTKKKK